MPTLDLELLRSLSAVVQQGSFAAGALQLGKTQSAVTQQMQRLEQQVGHALFEKHGRQKHLTDHGLRLLNYAQHLLAMNDEALRSLTDGAIEGFARIGAPHDVADTLLPPLLAEAARNTPLVKLEIQVGRSPYLMESLKSGEMDMVISNRADSEFDSLKLITTPTVWLCGKNYQHDVDKPVALVEANGPSIFRHIGRESLDQAGLPWTARHTSTSLVGIKAAVRAGLGVTARGREQLDLELRILGEPEGMPPLPALTYWLYVRRNVVNPVTRQLFNAMKAHFGAGNGEVV